MRLGAGTPNIGCKMKGTKHIRRLLKGDLILPTLRIQSVIRVQANHKHDPLLATCLAVLALCSACRSLVIVAALHGRTVCVAKRTAITHYEAIGMTSGLARA
jgi:hypothetical protein